MDEVLEDRWTEIAEKQLKGRTIVLVRYMSQEEADDMGWYERPLICQLDDGNIFFPSRDPEGNDAGVLFTNDERENIIPSL